MATRSSSDRGASRRRPRSRRRRRRGAGRVPPVIAARPLRPRPRVLPRLPSRDAHRGRLRRLDQRVGHGRSRPSRVSEEARPAVAGAAHLRWRWEVTSHSMTDRMIGALRLREATYEEVEPDEKATGEAAFIIVGTSLVSGAVNGVLTGVSSGLFGALGSFVGWAFYGWVAD